MRRPLADAGLFFILIIILVELIHPTAIPDHSGLDGTYASVSGRVSRIEYKLKDNEMTTIVYIDQVTSPTGISRRQSIMCTLASGQTEPRPGQSVTIRGTLYSFSPASNPGNFDFQKYYYIMKIALRLNDGCIIEACDPDRPLPAALYWRLKAGLSLGRRRISALCDLCFDSDDSSVIKTMLLGDKSTLSSETKSLYSQNGIAHILAISGLHISLIGMAFYRLLKKLRLPGLMSCVFSVLLMTLYGIMTGMAASAARALIMFIMRLLAPVFHRTFDMFTALVLAAVTILIGQPAYIFYSGFQFSFGAVAAILIVLPLLEDIFPKILSAGLSVNIVTLPVFLGNYYYFPVFSVLLNLYVIPLMSLLLVSAVISIAACALYIPLGKLVSIPAHLILLVYEWSCRLGSALPYNMFVTGKPENWQTAAYFALITLILIFSKKQTKFQILMNLCAAGLVLTMRLPDFSTGVTLVDVGQGDCIYVTNGCGTDILVDGGSSTVKNVGRYRIEPFLLSQGVASLDAVFITHMDSDHYSGILEMLADAGQSGPLIDRLILTTSTIKGGGDEYEAVIKAAEEADIPVYAISYEDTFTQSDISLDCLYPYSSCQGISTNDESLVMMLRKGNVNVLLTGDLAGEGEDAVTDILKKTGDPDSVNILKVAHHGSKNSTFQDFLDAFSPDLALISAGKGNSYGHPSEDLLDRLDTNDIPHYCTIDHGALTLRICGEDVTLTGYVDG